MGAWCVLAAALLALAAQPGALVAGDAPQLFAGGQASTAAVGDTIISAASDNVAMAPGPSMSPEAATECLPGCIACVGKGANAKCLKCATVEYYGPFPAEPGAPVYPVYLDPITHRCKNCTRHPFSSGCAECTIRGKCKRCNALRGYSMVGGRCVKCKKSANCGCDWYVFACNPCDATGYCTSCAEGHRLVKTKAGGVCKRCRGKGCSRCDANLRCTRCNDELIGRYGDGSGLDAAGNCQPCIPGCGECHADHRVCTECRGLYGDGEEHTWFLQGGTCKPCRLRNCATCANATTCKECDYPFGLVNGKCHECKVEDCEDCDGNPSRCKTCVPGTWYDAKANRCRACSDALGPLCQECTSATNCTYCDDRNYTGMVAPPTAIVGGKCRRQGCVDPNCANCLGNKKVCKKCGYGFLYAGKCVIPPGW